MVWTDVCKCRDSYLWIFQRQFRRYDFFSYSVGFGILDDLLYTFAHVDVLVFRKRLPNAPRNFKVPCGILFPVIGIVGTAYMILNISSDPQERMNIWLLTGACFIVLGIYSAVWIKFKMKMKVFKSVPLEKVMAMENELYYYVRKSRGIWK